MRLLRGRPLLGLPRVFVVPGFPKVTPDDFKDRLSSKEIDTLVEYLLSMKEGKGK